MTYTLTMAADEGIRIAKDGVAEVSMTDARANLTHLLRRVRYGDDVAAFTERGARAAYVVTPDFYNRALADRAALLVLAETIRRLPEGVRGEDWASELLSLVWSFTGDSD